jgi:integrase/recombinase XerD
MPPSQAACSIDSERKLLSVERGKGGRYRNAILPADPLTLLPEWWKIGAGGNMA